MKNKIVFYLLLVGLLSTVLLSTACGQTTEPNDDVSTIPHDLGVRFENCLSCHTSGRRVVPVDHIEYPSKLCSSPSCHPQSDEVPLPEWEPPVLATHDIIGAYKNCMVCHDVYKRYEPPTSADHVIHTNDICSICHEVPEE